MNVHFDLSALRKTQPHEYALRFAFGGLMTAIAGILAKHYGPVFGGLFLAFPAIFPASATLVEKHVAEAKARSGIHRTERGREAAALDARGTFMGSMALIGFAWMAWKLLPAWNGAAVLILAVFTWLALAVAIWRLRRRRLVFRLRKRRFRLHH